MKPYRAPVIMGLVFALLFGLAGLAGYSVVIYYTWPIILLVLLLLAAAILKRRLSATAYLCAAVILAGLSTAGAFAGHWGRRVHCRSKYKSCEPILELVQKYRTEHGHYPDKLTEVQGFALAQRNAGLRIGQGEFSEHGIDLDGINSYDALIYLDTNFVLCVVPVTKQLPLSFTRLYAYLWSSDRPSWKYDKLVWTF